MNRILCCLFAVAGLALIPALAPAQDYLLYWFTVDGGGGVSSGGSYTLHSTIGQPEAGMRLSGGTYTLQGGFWPGILVASTGETPTSLIQLSGTNVIISWAPAATGFSLEQSSSLDPGSWKPAACSGTNLSTVPLFSDPTFYRLVKR